MNMLTGSIPEELIRKVEDGSLSLRYTLEQFICFSYHFKAFINTHLEILCPYNR